MTKTSRTVVFFGTEEFSLAALTGLIEADYTIGAVVTKPDQPKGRGLQTTPPPIKTLAERYNIPVLQPDKVSDINDQIKSLGTTVGVLVSYGKIIPETTINLFNPGIINVHPSLLPKYRGPTPIESAIENNDQKTGVSIMQLSAKMDAGPVYTKKECILQGTETQANLYHTLADIGTNLLLETLPRIVNGSLTPLSQDEAEATYCSLLSKRDSFLNLETLTAERAECIIRAHLNFPKSKVDYKDHVLIVTKAHVSTSPTKSLDYECSDGKFLCIDELIAPSGRRMTADAFLHGNDR